MVLNDSKKVQVEAVVAAEHFEDDESNPFLNQDDSDVSLNHQITTRRSCVNSKVRWLMFKTLKPKLRTDEEIVAAQWILCHCYKQLPYDRNWWSRMERTNGELSLSNVEINRQIDHLNSTLFNFVHQLVRATIAVKKYIDGIDPVTNTLRKRDWNASTSLSEWISGDRGLLIKKLANNEPDVRNVKQFLPECLSEQNLKEALHNGGILIFTEQFPSTRAKRAVPAQAGLMNHETQLLQANALLPTSTRAAGMQLNLVRPGAADTRMLDITLMDGSILPVRRSRCSLGIPAAFVSDPVVIPKICVYDFSNGLHLYIFYRGHKMGKRKRPKFHVAEQHHLVHATTTTTGRSLGQQHTLDQDMMVTRARMNAWEQMRRAQADNEDHELHPLAKRTRSENENTTENEGDSRSTYAQLLPGLSVPIHIKQDLENLNETRHHAMTDRRELNSNNTEQNPPVVTTYSPGLSGVRPPHGSDFAYTSNVKGNDLNSTLYEDGGRSSCLPVACHEGYSVPFLNPIDSATTTVPVQAVFVGPDESTYLLNAVLVVEILSESQKKANYTARVVGRSQESENLEKANTKKEVMTGEPDEDRRMLDDPHPMAPNNNTETQTAESTEPFEVSIKIEERDEGAPPTDSQIDQPMISSSNTTIASTACLESITSGMKAKDDTQEQQPTGVDLSKEANATKGVRTAVLELSAKTDNNNNYKLAPNSLLPRPTLLQPDMSSPKFPNSTVTSPRLISATANTLSSIIGPPSPTSCKIGIGNTDLSIREIDVEFIRSRLVNVTVLAMRTE